MLPTTADQPILHSSGSPTRTSLSVSEAVRDAVERVTRIELAFSAWELRFAPETRMNAGIGVPTMSAATALRQHNKVPAALAGFSKTPLFRNELLAQIGDVDTDRSMGSTSASPGASHDTPSPDVTDHVDSPTARART